MIAVLAVAIIAAWSLAAGAVWSHAGGAAPGSPGPGKPAVCAGCFMAGTDWDAHRCQGTPEAPCFCFCQFDFTPEEGE